MRNAKRIIAMMIVVAMMAMTLVSCDMSSIVGDLLQDPDVQDAIINEFSSEIESYIIDEYSSEIGSYLDEYSSAIDEQIKNEATAEKNTESKTESKTETKTEKTTSSSGNSWWNDLFGGNNVQTGVATNTEYVTVAPPEYEYSSAEIYYPEEDTPYYDEFVTEFYPNEEWPDEEEGEFEYELCTDQEGYQYYILTSIGTWRGKKLTISAEYNGVPVKRIGYCAFMGAYGIESVTILEGVEGIDMWAFGYCESLTQIYLPSTLTYMSQRVFTYSDNVSLVHVNEGLESRYYVYNNCIIDRESNMLHTAFNCSDIEQTLWDLKIAMIGDDACRGVTTLKVIKLPDSVQSIGAYAFYDCMNLDTLSFGSSECRIMEIGVGAFSYCESLRSISMSRGGNDRYLEVDNCIIDKKTASLVLGCVNSIIPDDGSITSIGHSAFEGCTRLNYIYIPASVKTIEREAFDGCTNLSKVVLPYGLERIEYLAFADTYCLDYLEIPETIIYIDDEAFRGSAYNQGGYGDDYNGSIEMPEEWDSGDNDIAWETDVEWDSGNIDIEWTPDYEISTLPGYEIEWSTSIIINGSYGEMMTGGYIEFGSGNSYFEIITGAYGSSYEVVTDSEGNTYYYYYAVPSPTEP